MKRIKTIVPIAIFILLIYLAVYFYVTRSSKLPPEIRIATGSTVGTYHKIGLGLKEILEREHPDLKVDLVNSKGSSENVSLLGQGLVDVAFFQSGSTSGSDSLRAIGNLYSEVVHLIVKKRLNLSDIYGLKGKTAAVGPKNSGTELIARQILEYHNIPYDSLDVKYYTFEEMIQHDGELDACFIVSGLKAKAAEGLLESGDNMLMPIEAAGGFSYETYAYSKFTIPPGLYGGSPLTPETEVETIATKACLVAVPETPKVVVKTILEALLKSQLKQRLNIKELSEEFVQSNLEFPTHPGANSYFNRWKPPIDSGFVEAWSGIRESAAFAVVCIYMAVSFLIRAIKRRRKEAVDLYLKELNTILLDLNKTKSFEEIDEVHSRWLTVQTEAVDKFTNEELQDQYFDDFLRKSEIVQAAIYEKTRAVEEGRG